MVDPKSPPNRQLMAVPFVGKDVPSRASEFAHPDVLIGLTVLAYRYEGVRQADLHRVIVQLKTDMSRQVGPRDQRPASVLFQQWVALARAQQSREDSGQPLVRSPSRSPRRTGSGSSLTPPANSRYRCRQTAGCA